MESEIISITANILHAPNSYGGSVTSGGTESIFLSVKAHRDLFLSSNPLASHASIHIVLPASAHPAFFKAAHILSITPISVPINKQTGQINTTLFINALSSSTALAVASAPSFPHGIIDNIPEIAAACLKRNIPLHIDSCLGGFLSAFADEAGFPLPHHVDFRINGVSSISIDTHKYGFAPKGTSVIIYKSKKLLHHQYFIQTDWPGGIYGSPSLAGSRPGALIAACYATMLHLGHSGYVNTTKTILSAAYKIKLGIANIQNVRVIGNPLLSVVAFQSIPPSNTYALADILSKLGWHLNILQHPPAIHIACTLLTPPAVDNLLSDIQSAISQIKENPSAGKGDVAAIYGSAATIPDRSIVKDITTGFLDALTMVDLPEESKSQD